MTDRACCLPRIQHGLSNVLRFVFAIPPSSATPLRRLQRGIAPTAHARPAPPSRSADPAGPKDPRIRLRIRVNPPPDSPARSTDAARSVDGVLVRQQDPIPRAREALLFLQRQCIPFILLTNGGGKTEAERVEELSGILGVPLDPSVLIQSHTPFASMNDRKRSTVLVVGGDADKCRLVAERWVP